MSIRPITASDVVIERGGCTEAPHDRHWIGCAYCKKNRDEMLARQRLKNALDRFIDTQPVAKRAYYRDVAEQYAAGLDS